jgi:hypothetical protein
MKPKTVWIDGEAAKGYDNEDFTEVYRRYVPRSEYDAMMAEQGEWEKSGASGGVRKWESAPRFRPGEIAPKIFRTEIWEQGLGPLTAD